MSGSSEGLEGVVRPRCRKSIRPLCRKNIRPRGPKGSSIPPPDPNQQQYQCKQQQSSASCIAEITTYLQIKDKEIADRDFVILQLRKEERHQNVRIHALEIELAEIKNSLRQHRQRSRADHEQQTKNNMPPRCPIHTQDRDLNSVVLTPSISCIRTYPHLPTTPESESPQPMNKHRVCVGDEEELRALRIPLPYM